jgi:hypothetical protein
VAVVPTQTRAQVAEGAEVSAVAGMTG